MRKAVESIRQIPEINHKRKVMLSLFVVLSGLVLGLVAKATDSVSVIGEIGTGLGIWVFIVTLIAAFSFTPITAMLNALLFFLSLLFSYYLYGKIVLGFFPKAYFTGWLIVSLLSPIGAFLVWLSRGKGRIAKICASLPVAVLFALGYPAYYTFQITQLLDLIFAVILIISLQRAMRDRLAVLAISCVFSMIIAQFYLLAYLPW